MNIPPVKDRPYSRKEVVDIIQSAMANLCQGTEQEEKLREQLTSIINYIQNMRAELAQMRSIEISHNHIPAATDELDAVVAETARATGVIMDQCEIIEKIAANSGQDDLTNCVTAIYEACSFQDITGQRITKVVRALKNIETKVADIIEAIGHAPVHNQAKQNDAPAKAALLNGPAIGGPSISQEEIDKLLESFDK